MLRAIRMSLWPNMDNRNNTPRPLVSLNCASGTNFTSGFIPQIDDVTFRMIRPDVTGNWRHLTAKREHCDLKNVVTYAHVELWRPPDKNVF